MATTAMVDWIKVLEVCVSNKTTLMAPVIKWEGVQVATVRSANQESPH